MPVSLITVASAGPVGGEYFATATLAGGDDPTGTVTFSVYGPGDHECARQPVFASTNPVTGAGNVKQATSNPARLLVFGDGIYHFVATYSGDARNAPAGPTDCRNPGATVGFGSSSSTTFPGDASSISFAATASRPAVVGGSMFDTAEIATSAGPTGSVTFDLYGPTIASCTGAPVFSSTVPVQGSRSYTSEGYVPVASGTYRWVARYSGDANNPALVTPCQDPNQLVEVAPAAPTASSPCALLSQQQALAARVTGLQALRSRANQGLASLLGCRAVPPR